MLSPEETAAYRRMTPEQRWREIEELMTLEEILKIATGLDLEYLRSWARQLGVTGRLDAFLAAGR